MNTQPTDPAEEFQPGDLVKYVPYHAAGNSHHPDCDTGKVTSLNSAFVFVRFSGSTSQACNPDQLRLLAR